MASSKHTAPAKIGAQARTARGRAAQPAMRGRTAPSAAAGSEVLGQALTIAEVAHAARAFTAMLAGGTAHVDARALKSIDTAGLQLLLAAAIAAQERGLTLALDGAPELLHGAADALGVDGELTAAMGLTA